MRHTMVRTRRIAIGLIAAAVLAGVSACGGTASTETRKPPATFDKSLHDLLPESVLDRGVLRVGTDASYAPMSAFGPDGRTIIGMEPDLGAEIGKVLGVRVEFLQTDFTDILPEVVSGGLDLGMSAMTDTPERARKVDFINYFSAGTSIVVQRGNPAGITEIQDLCGRVVAVEAGTTQVDLLSRAQRNCAGSRIDVQTFPTNSDALVRLRTGRAVAVLNDLPPAVFLVNDPRTQAQYQLASSTTYEAGLYGIVVSKQETRLRDAVQGACEALFENGTYAEVLEHWDVTDGTIDRVSINSNR